MNFKEHYDQLKAEFSRFTSYVFTGKESEAEVLAIVKSIPAISEIQANASKITELETQLSTLQETVKEFKPGITPEQLQEVIKNNNAAQATAFNNFKTEVTTEVGTFKSGIINAGSIPKTEGAEHVAVQMSNPGGSKEEEMVEVPVDLGYGIKGTTTVPKSQIKIESK